MKAKNLFFGALTCLAFAACSNDDEPTVNGGGAQGQNSYMAVNLAMASDMTRATTDEGFENGTEEESAVKVANAKFYFYGADGAYITTGTVAKGTGQGQDPTGDDFLTLENVTDDTPNNVQKQSNALIVLGPTQTQPKYVIAVLNSTEDLANKSMSEVYNLLTSAAITTAKGGFVMTNSTYYDASGEKVYAQEIASDEICETVAAAIANPVEIYVERLVSKIKLTNGTGGTLEFPLTSDETKEVLNTGSTTTPVQMKVIIDGWRINALNTSSYFIKNLSQNPNTFKTGYNVPGQFRSFWAEDKNYSGNSESFDGNTYADLTYYTFAQVTNTTSNYEYCYENTVSPTNVQADGGDRTNTPCMLIAAHTVYSTDGGSSYAAVTDLYRYNGQLWTLDTYKNLYLNALKKKYVWAKDDKSASQSIVDTDLEWNVVKASGVTTANDFKQVMLNITAATAPADMFLYEYTVEGELASATKIDVGNVVATINAALSATDMASKTEGYKEGKCYYQVPIEHLFSAADNEVYGVVRNHIYNLNLTGVTKLGDAVYFPEETLEYIPGERKNYYVAAQLKVLTWRVVSQNVEL